MWCGRRIFTKVKLIPFNKTKKVTYFVTFLFYLFFSLNKFLDKDIVSLSISSSLSSTAT